MSLPLLVILATIVSGPLAMVEAAEPPVFEEVARTGVAWPDYEYRDNAWGGGAWGDYDEDGWLDIFLPNHPSLYEPGMNFNDSALMHNNGDGTFTNVIYETGIKLQEDWHDVFWVDYDDDGDLDLWRAVGGRGGYGEGPSSLSRQNADGSFSEVAVEAGVDYPVGRGRGTVWQDYDGDGDLDLYFTGAQSDTAPNTMFRNNGDGTFTNVGQLGTDTFTGANSQATAADYDMDGDDDMLVTGYAPRLYRNDGGTFTNVTSSAGIVGCAGAQGADWGDYDNDGDLDVFITRGTMSFIDYSEVWNESVTDLRFYGEASSGDEDGLDFVSNGSVTFELQTRDMGSPVRRDASEVNLGPDGHHPSEYPFTLGPGDVTDPPPAASDVHRVWQQPQGSWHIRWSGSGNGWEFSGMITAEVPLSDIVEVGFEVSDPPAVPNRLFRNNGDGTFTDVSEAAGVADPQDCRGADWGDYDNDGYLDLFVQTAGWVGTNAPNLVYRNNGDGTFTDVAAQANLEGTDEGYGWGGVWGDYNNDGFLDLFTHQESWSWPLDRGGYELFRNGGNENHWLKIELQGLGVANGGSNRRGYGAKVWITAGGLTQYHPVHDSSHYLYHYSGPIHVGLGEHTVVDELQVEWPSGLTQVLSNLPADRLYTVVEGGAPPPEADLAVSKSDLVDPVVEGEDVTYTVSVSNGGPDTAESVVLSDDLPAGVIFVSATPEQGTCSEATGVVTCDLGAINSGASVNMTIVVTTTTEGTITNSASATSDTDDPGLGNNSASEETTVDPAAGPEADLAVSKSDAVDPVTEGDDVTYTVNVSNGGPDTAENVVLTDDLPDGVIYDDAASSAECDETAPGVVTCNLGDMVNGASVDVTIVVNAPTAGTLTNTASATSDTSDPDTGNNSASEETTVDPAAGPEADLAVSKSDAVDPVTEGDDVTYTVNVSNGGPDTAENVVLTDNLPTGVSFVSVTPGAPDCTESSGVVTCDLGAIASGANVDVTIVVNTITDGTITNSASVTADTGDPDAGNNSASEETTVNPAAGPEADLAVSKSDADDPVTEGDDVVYTVNVSNNGPDTAENVVLTDNLPDGVVYNDAASSAECDETAAGVVTCDLGAIASGAGVDLTVVVNTTTDGTITNEASATSNTSDPDTGNNSASEETTVDPSSPPTEIIVDNLDPEFTTSGWWNTYTGTRYPSYNDSFRYTREGSGEREATFTPDITNAGDYEVFIWYFTTPGSATNTPYTINFNGGSTTVRLNCQGDIGGGYWYSLGVYNFASGTSGNIVISNDADGFVEADAVRLVLQ